MSASHCVSRVFCECFSINNKFNLTDRFVLIDFIITLDMATLLFRWTKVQAKEKAMYQGQCRRSTCHFGSRRIRNIPHSQTFTYVFYINHIHLYNILNDCTRTNHLRAVWSKLSMIPGLNRILVIKRKFRYHCQAESYRDKID